MQYNFDTYLVSLEDLERTDIKKNMLDKLDHNIVFIRAK